MFDKIGNFAITMTMFLALVIGIRNCSDSPGLSSVFFIMTIAFFYLRKIEESEEA